MRNCKTPLVILAVFFVPVSFVAQSLFDSGSRERFRRPWHDDKGQATVKPAQNPPLGEIIWVDDLGKYAVIWLDSSAAETLPANSILRVSSIAPKSQPAHAKDAVVPKPTMLRVIRHRAKQRAVGVRIEQGLAKPGDIITRAIS